MSAKDWKVLSSALTHINRPTVVAPHLLCEAEKAQLEFQVLTVPAHSSPELSSPRGPAPS